MEGHNTWCVNVPGLAARHPGRPTSPSTCSRSSASSSQNGYCDLRRRQRPPDPGARASSADLVDVEEPFPLTFAEQYALTEADGRARHRLLRRRADAPGDGARRLDVRRDRPLLDARRLGQPRRPRPRLPLRRGRALVDCPTRPGSQGSSRPTARRTTPTCGGGRGLRRAQVRRRRAVQPRDARAPGGTAPAFRGSAQVHDEEFKACVALQAQYIFDTFGKFPGTVPTLFILNYVQAHHLDLDFYDRFFKPGRLPAARTPSTCSAGTAGRGD